MGITCTKLFQRDEEEDWPVADYSSMNSSAADLTGVVCKVVWSPTRPISPVESIEQVEEHYLSPPTIDLKTLSPGVISPVQAIEEHYVSPPTIDLKTLSPGVNLVEAQPRQQIIENQKSEVDRKRSHDQLNESYEEQEEQENVDANANPKLPATTGSMALVPCQNFKNEICELHGTSLVGVNSQISADLVGVNSAPLALTPSTKALVL